MLVLTQVSSMKTSCPAASQPLAHGLKGDRPLSGLEDHPAYAEELLAVQGIADHRKRLLAYGIAWCDVVRFLNVASVDLAARNEPLNVDRVRVLDDKPGRLGLGEGTGVAARPPGRPGFRIGASLIGDGAGGWTVAAPGRLA